MSAPDERDEQSPEAEDSEENKGEGSESEESNGESAGKKIQRREMPERTTRGKRYCCLLIHVKGRMHELIGKAREEDDKFWQEFGMFQEVESDDDYVASSAGEDVVDSDFDQPEEEEAAAGDENESTKERVQRKKKEPGYVPRPRPAVPKQPAKLPDAPAGGVEEQDAQSVQADKDKIPQPPKKTKRLTAEVPLPMEQVRNPLAT